MPEIRQQIDSLREAFSADTTQPFELRANFPYGTPKKSSDSNTPTEANFPQDVMTNTMQAGQPSFAGVPMAAGAGLMNQSAATHTMALMSTGQNDIDSMQMSQQGSQWNPTRIFE